MFLSKRRGDCPLTLARVPLRDASCEGRLSGPVNVQTAHSWELYTGGTGSAPPCDRLSFGFGRLSLRRAARRCHVLRCRRAFLIRSFCTLEIEHLPSDVVRQVFST